MKNNIIEKNFGLILLSAIILIIIIFYGPKINQSLITNNFTNANQANPDTVVQYQNYSVMLSLDKTQICSGDYVQISIQTNIPNGMCAVFVNPNNIGWQYLTNIDLNANGNFAQLQQVSLAQGTYLGKVVCGDSKGNMKISNGVTLIVNFCSSPANNTPSDSGGQSQTSCNSVWNPSSVMCSSAICSGGKICTFFPDTLTIAKHCSCV